MNDHRFLFVIPVILIFFSCSTAQYSVSTLPRPLTLTVVSGTVQVVVRGQINQNTDSSLVATNNPSKTQDTDPYRMNLGTPTMYKVVVLSAGQVFRYNSAPSETVSLTLTCLGDTDASVRFSDGRTTRSYEVKKDNLVGQTIYIAN